MSDLDLQVIQCRICGVEFGLSQSYDSVKRRSHTGFRCPNGHILQYPEAKEDSLESLKKKIEEQETEILRLKRENISLYQQIEQLEGKVSGDRQTD